MREVINTIKRKWLLSLAIALFLSGQMHAQNGVSANLTAGAAADSNCGPTNCLTVTVNSNSGGATFDLTGTFSGTLTFEASGNNGASYRTLSVTPSNSTTTVTTATGVGTWQANIAGYTQIRIRFSTYSSGTATASITPSLASARTGGSGGGGSGTVSGQASGVIPLGTSATVIGSQSHCDDGVTTAATVTCSEPVAAGGAGPSTFGAGIQIEGGSTLATSNQSGTGSICMTSGSLCNNPILNLVEFDDFISNAPNAPISKLGWQGRGNNNTVIYQTGSWPHLGIAQIVTDATSSDATSLEIQGSGAGYLGLLGANAPWDSHFIFKLSENAAETVEIGYDDANFIKPDTGTAIDVRYIAGTDTNFTFETCSAGTCTTSSANSVAVDTSWHDVRIQSLVAGEITFSIDSGGTTCFTNASATGCSGATTVVHNAHIPAAALTPTHYLLTSANVAKHLQIDYFGFSATLSR